MMLAEARKNQRGLLQSRSFESWNLDYHSQLNQLRMTRAEKCQCHQGLLNLQELMGER
jgi:hypothetical protein